MLAAAHQRELLGPGVRHIAGDVPEVLPHPPERHARGMPVLISPERHHERQRQNQLKQCATERGKDVPAPPEYQVPRLVDRQVQGIGQVEA